jgi:hypothetical protein
MELCIGGRGARGHDEICFDSDECPLCAAKKAIGYREDTITNLEQQLAEHIETA